MYQISKRMEIAGSHKLDLDYPSPCGELHGHNWIVIVHIRGPNLNYNGMLIDFAHIKKEIHDLLDHKNFNDVLPKHVPTTAESLACWICEKINLLDKAPGAHCYKVEIWESEGNRAVYINESK